MGKIVHAQTVIPLEVLEQLKRKTGESATKDAIAKAIEHYLVCPYTHEEPFERRLEEIMRKRREK
ncbi:MAG: DUF5371 domain-containing protein [Archaeoglobaceae archaeon]|nr:DUF5371 domain-containing protein [Archaeoglobaceae archaeon]MCX8152631.1 DUF5371 domain-containing protein [Archaeoglobaceae archaeon]MDW8014087.1 DUF5371 family protein [Archaeoglobaceae archaeon]